MYISFLLQEIYEYHSDFAVLLLQCAKMIRHTRILYLFYWYTCVSCILLRIFCHIFLKIYWCEFFLPLERFHLSFMNRLYMPLCYVSYYHIVAGILFWDLSRFILALLQPIFIWNLHSMALRTS